MESSDQFALFTSCKSEGGDVNDTFSPEHRSRSREIYDFVDLYFIEFWWARPSCWRRMEDSYSLCCSERFKVPVVCMRQQSSGRWETQPLMRQE
jgi:hypothetical protein